MAEKTLAERLRAGAGVLEDLADEADAAHDREWELREELTEAEDTVGLDDVLADIADVQRGLLTLDELFDRHLRVGVA